MKLKIILLTLFILLIPLSLGQEECQRTQNSRDVPCILTSTFNYTPPCNASTADIFLENGTFIQNSTFRNAGDTGLCQITWNITTLGSYIFTVDNGDTGNITITKEVFRLIGIMIGLALAVLYFAIMGFANTNPSLRFVSFFLSFIELLISIFILYAHEANGAFTNVLKINFLAIAFIGFGLFVLTYLDFSFRFADWNDDLTKVQSNVKWK